MGLGISRSYLGMKYLVQVQVPIHSFGRGVNIPAVASYIMCGCVSTPSRVLVLYHTYEWCEALLTYKAQVSNGSMYSVACVLHPRMLWCHAAAAKRWRYMIWTSRGRRNMKAWKRHIP